MRKLMFLALLCLSLVLATSALADAAQPDVDLTNLDTVDAIDELYATLQCGPNLTAKGLYS